MKKILIISLSCLAMFSVKAQKNLTPEALWKLGRVSGLGISKDDQFIIFTVSTPNVAENKSTTKLYEMATSGGEAVELKNTDSVFNNPKISKDGKFMISSKPVRIWNVSGAENYPDLKKSNVLIYNSLDYRHWDDWEDGNFDHVFLTPVVNGTIDEKHAKDLMPNEAYDCPQKPFGDEGDFIWRP
ncbi:MAG TPA: hypothetical protein VG842_05005, partial [Sediminibacterium sp.]|nr:hypothetical protein [Sediminibacterium sp.]